MPRSRMLFALCSLAIAGGLLASRPAQAAFAQSWSTSDWQFHQVIGSCDDDVQPELLFVHRTSGRYAIFDALSGAIEEEFPATYTTSNSVYTAGDVDGDGRTDFLILSFPESSPLFFRAYRWNGSDYVPFLAHADTLASFPSVVPFLPGGGLGLVEVTGQPDDPTSHPTCDLRLRDLAGNVLFRASTDVAGWSRPLRAYSWVDRTQDGIPELVLEDQAGIRVFHQYSGSFTVAWSLPGWSRLVQLGDLDGDAPTEYLATSNADGHYAIVDGATGAIQQEFPAFQFPMTTMAPVNVDGDNPNELVVQQASASPQPPVLSILDWNGGSFAPIASITASGPYSNLGVVQVRSPFLYEIVELSDNDVRLHDFSGTLLFRASTDVPGWAVAPFSLGYDLIDTDLSGIPDLVLYDPSHVWNVRYNGSFVTQWTANGWAYLQALGSVDGDAQSEFMLYNAADSRFAIFDALTGANQQEFPGFGLDNSSYQTFDADGDNSQEIYFGRNPGQSPLFTAYEWDGSGYAPLYSHTESMGIWSVARLRSDSQLEFLEMDAGDIRLRDVAVPTVLFRAATDLPAWPGQSGSIAFPGCTYPGADPGVQNLFVFDDTRFRVVALAGTVGVPGSPGAAAFHVFPNAPNPFRAGTAFRISNPRAGDVGIRIYDAAGRLVRRLDRTLPAGTNEIRWDGQDDRGRNAPSGVLFCEVTVDGMRQARKLIRTP